MTPTEAMKMMVDRSGRGAEDISAAMGRSRTYVWQMLSQGSMPRTDTLARLAHECGYRVLLRSGEDEIELYEDGDPSLFAWKMRKVAATLSTGDIRQAIDELDGELRSRGVVDG